MPEALLKRQWIYVQPINDPTAPRGTERRRIIPTPIYSTRDIGALVMRLRQVWNSIGMDPQAEYQGLEPA